MAKCNFCFRFPGSPERLVRRIDAAIKGAGGAFSGDATQGSFSVPTPVGRIEGAYRVREQTIDIDITDKPLLLPCRGIEQKLREYLRRG